MRSTSPSIIGVTQATAAAAWSTKWPTRRGGTVRPCRRVLRAIMWGRFMGRLGSKRSAASRGRRFGLMGRRCGCMLVSEFAEPVGDNLRHPEVPIILSEAKDLANQTNVQILRFAQND